MTFKVDRKRLKDFKHTSFSRGQQSIRTLMHALDVPRVSARNGLASRRKFWTCVQLAFRLATHLRRLACYICCYKNALTNDMRESYGFLRLANPFGYPSQVLQPCVDLRRFASPFGQGFNIVPELKSIYWQTQKTSDDSGKKNWLYIKKFPGKSEVQFRRNERIFQHKGTMTHCFFSAEQIVQGLLCAYLLRVAKVTSTRENWLDTCAKYGE